jgi:predicted amidophosphoribosyltransferase
MGFVGAIGGKLAEPVKRKKTEIKTWAAEEQWICRNCGAEIPAGKYSCNECGAPVVE